MSSTAAPVVNITRTIPAPPHRVYRAWLDPEVLQQWMAAGDRHVARVEVDERVGGAHRTWWATDDGTSVGGFESEIVELVPDERLVFRWGFVGPERTAGPAFDSLLTVTLAPAGDDATTLTLVHERLDDLHVAMPEVAAKVRDGWDQALDRLQPALTAGAAREG
jgi:uncharacterized protein YndB with AHSA1/START domain